MVLSAQISDFDKALIESVDEAVRSLFSQQVLDALHSNLKVKRSIKPEEFPNQLPTLSTVLEKYFGLGSSTVERAIAQRLYSKLGLKFQRIDSYQLADYVENARNKPKSAAPSFEPTNVNLPLKEDFNRLLVESVREAIEDVLGKDSAKSAFRFLERDVPFDKLPQHLPTFYLALKKNFGKDCGMIEMAIARKLYLKLSLEFIETPNTELARYVELAIIKLSQREELGFNISARMEGRSSKTTNSQPSSQQPD
jgi:hypothetical protein